MGFPLLEETADRVAFRITPSKTFRFDRTEETVSPAHLAFEVRHSTFESSSRLIEEAGLAVSEVRETTHTFQRYFKDADGNLLEIYSHDYIDETALPQDNPLGVLYLREVGFVVDDFVDCWEDFRNLGLIETGRGTREGPFCILASGTAHAVLNHRSRRWIPIDMTALKPDLQVTLGASLATDSELTLPALTGEGYDIRIEHTPDFDPSLPERLGVPRVDRSYRSSISRRVSRNTTSPAVLPRLIVSSYSFSRQSDDGIKHPSSSFANPNTIR